MAGEIQFSFTHAATAYALIRSASGQIWNNLSGAFENYSTLHYTGYPVSVVEQGTNSAFYVGNFPSVGAGFYGVVGKQQLGSNPAETDPTVAAGNVEWNGSAVSPRSDNATSGQVGQYLPLKIYRGQMVQNFPFKLVSATDNVTPFTSGVVSGQISRDGASFGVLQSGAFTEIGKGWYSLQALTSGDLLANSVALVFTANGVSGGQSAQRDFGFVLQRTSGQ